MTRATSLTSSWKRGNHFFIHLRVWCLILLMTGIMGCKSKPFPAAQGERTLSLEEIYASVSQKVHASHESASRAALRGWVHDTLSPPAKRPESFRRGISLGLFASTTNEEEQRAIYSKLLDEIESAGATDISIVVRWSQDTVKTAEIGPAEGVTIDDALVRHVLRDAHRRGLRTFLMPIIWLKERKMGVWRGTLRPTDPERWWSQYTAFIHHYARLAQEEHVGLYSVGSELLSMETKRERWIELIRSTRAIYHGDLTYSANWDHFEVPTFWDELDVVGMTAYQELGLTRDPGMEDLARGWAPFVQRLSIWAREHDYRYIFTEIGYPSHSRGAAYPWNYSASAEVDHVLQAKCYAAMFEQWHEDDRLEGLYIWNWFGFRDRSDRGYTPRGKLAEEVLKHWYAPSSPPPAIDKQ